MKFNIAEAEKNIGAKYEFHFVVPAEDLDIELTGAEIAGMIEFFGTAVFTGRVYRFEGRARLTKKFQCDRCLELSERTQEYPFCEEFKRRTDGLAADDKEDVNWFDGDDIELAEAFREIVILSQPLNNICDSGCRGLCLKCGANLNKGECGCDRTVIDPRLAALQKLLIKK
jgi:uncharacterized protein